SPRAGRYRAGPATDDDQDSRQAGGPRPGAALAAPHRRPPGGARRDREGARAAAPDRAGPGRVAHAAAGGVDRRRAGCPAARGRAVAESGARLVGCPASASSRGSGGTLPKEEQPPVRTGVWKTFQSLSVRNYRLFATGQLGRLIAVWMIFVAQDWLVLKLSGDSAAAVGFTVALQFTPVMLLSLVGGALADRYDKRKLLMIVNSAWSVVATILAILVLTGAVRLWHVFTTAALIGVANAMENPIRQSFISELVGNTLLPNALALNSAIFNTARIAGPAFAGGAIALIGLGSTFLIAAVAAISPLFSLSRMRPKELHREGVPAPGTRRARIVDGLLYVARRSDLAMPIALVAVVGAAGFNFQVTLPVLSKVVYHTGPAAFGLLAA